MAVTQNWSPQPAMEEDSILGQPQAAVCTKWSPCSSMLFRAVPWTHASAAMQVEVKKLMVNVSLRLPRAYLINRVDTHGWGLDVRSRGPARELGPQAGAELCQTAGTGLGAPVHGQSGPAW